MLQEIKILLISFVLNMLLPNSELKQVTCVPRSFGYDSIVCTCNSTYCDFIPQIEKPDSNKFLIYTSNKGGERFNLKMNEVSTDKINNGLEIFLEREVHYQKIYGWGGAFTDAAGINILKLSKATQKKLLTTYFGDNGSRYNLGRVPIGGTDFSTRPYTYDDVVGDINLNSFALQMEDLVYKIPFIQGALQINPELLLVGAAWTAPPWMKTNKKINGVGFLDDKYYQTYANYLLKFLDEYKSHNLTFWAISTGNEPNNVYLLTVPINSMGWTPSKMSKWVTENFGPTLANSTHNSTAVLILDDQRLFLPWYVELVFENERVRKYVNGIAIHWYLDKYISPIQLDKTQELYPDLFTIITEACTGFLRNDIPKVQLGSWKRGEFYILKMIENINHGVSGWIDWNLALNTKGGPNWINNNVDAPIIVNSKKDEFYKQPTYYAITHFSRFVPRNSVRIKITENDDIKATAFETPSKEVVLILCNTNENSQNITIIGIKNRYINVQLSPSSWNTIIY